MGRQVPASIFPTRCRPLCAEALRAGTADIGIIPAAAYTTIPDLVIIPDVAIAARQAVRSILLVSKVPIERGTNGRARYFVHDLGGADQDPVREVAGRSARL